MPLDSLDRGLCLRAVGDAVKVGDGVRSRGDKMPGRRREPNAMVTTGVAVWGSHGEGRGRQENGC